MRLLTKTSLNYIWITLSVLLLSSFLLCFFMYREVSAEIREQLELQEVMVFEELKAGRPVNFPLVKLTGYEGRIADFKPLFKDTLVFDHVQKVKEDYYLLRRARIINGKQHIIQVMTTHIGWSEYYRTIALVFLFIALLLITVGSYINYLLNKRIWLPFVRNLEQLKDFSVSSGMTLELADSKIREFRELSKVTNELAVRVKSEYETLKEFTENASHEIQTPLSIIQSRLERISQEPLSESVSLFLQDIKHAVSRLSKINKGLLLLAKLDNKSFPDERLVDLKTCIDQHLGQLEDLYNFKHLNLTLNLEKKEVMASVLLLDVLVSNLLSNQINHTAQAGEVRITLDHKKMEFANTGDALIFEHQKLFLRFGKKALGSEGNGLGLPIVKQICLLYGWDIAYSYHNSQHSFRIEFNN